MKTELLIEMMRIAVRSIRSNLLRTSLTIAIIGLGIMALISMTTATSSLEANVTQQFSTLGTDVFTIQQRTESGVDRGMRVKAAEPITYEEAQRFADEGSEDITISYSVYGTGQATLTRGQEQTNPNIQILGVEENYLNVSGFDLASGRNFNSKEAASAQHLALLGADLVKELFDPWEEPIGSEFSVG